MKRSRFHSKWWTGVVAILLALGVACNLPRFAGLPGQSAPPAQQAETPPGPRVTIQSPVFGAQFAEGSTFPVYVLAADESGVTRIDLWVDGTLVLSQSAPAGQKVTPLVLSYPMIAARAGNYTLLARAYNGQGEVGESALHYVSVYEQPTASRQQLARYVVQPGDTLESIARKVGTTVEELRRLNPALGNGEVKAGIEILIPMPKPAPPQAAVPPNPGGQQGGQAGPPGILPALPPAGGAQPLPPGQGGPEVLPIIDLFPSWNVPAGVSLQPPSNLVPLQAANCTVSLQWKDNATGETGYKVYRYDPGATQPKEVASLPPDTHLYVDKGLPSSGRYVYKVAAVQKGNGAAQRALSPPLTVLVPPTEKCLPSARFYRIFFQPLAFQPRWGGIDQVALFIHLHDVAIRIPRAQQTYANPDNWGAYRYTFPVGDPASQWSHGTLKFALYAYAYVSDGVQPPVRHMGELLVEHKYADLLEPNASSQVWQGRPPDGNVTLTYKLWMQEWWWNGTSATSTTLPAPSNVQRQGDVVTWDYPEAYLSKLDTFVLYRWLVCPGRDMRPLPPTRTRQLADFPIRDASLLPLLCGMQVRVSAIAGSEESPPSESIFIPYDNIKNLGAENQKVDDIVRVVPQSLSIASDALPAPRAGEIILTANAYQRSSTTMLLEARTYDLHRDVVFNGRRGNEALRVALSDPYDTVTVGFQVPGVCAGRATLTAPDAKDGSFTRDWHALAGKEIRITSTNGKCTLTLTVDQDAASPRVQQAAQRKSGGQPCARDNDCASGRCLIAGGQGRCDLEQPAPAGSYCFLDRQCLGGVCECVKDGEEVPCNDRLIPGQGFPEGFCKAPSGAGHLADLGDSCSQNGDCASGHCAENICAPKDGTGQVGMYCHHNNHCANGYCFCPTGWDGAFCHDFKEVADDPNRRGYCGEWPGYANGEPCTDHNDCRSRYCANGVCAPKDGTGLPGEYCHHDNHCMSGKCDCPDNLFGESSILTFGFCPRWEQWPDDAHGKCTKPKP